MRSTASSPGSTQGALAANPVRPHAFEQRLVGLAKLFEATGDVAALDRGKREPRRLVVFRISAPGYSLPTDATFEYRELYERRRDGWLLVRYAFEYRPKPIPSRRAYHLHEPIGEHQHCVPAGGAADQHFRAYRVSLLEAHEEFTAAYASRQPIRCDGLRPLRMAAS